MRIFNKAMQTQAWNRLQAAIDAQLRLTPGEYDVISLVEHVATDMRNEVGLSYTRIADYLEARYKEDTDCV